MYSHKRRARPWFIRVKFLILLVAVPVIAISTLDGINYREITGLLIVMAVGLLVAHHADRLHSQIDDLERRLSERKTPG